MDLQFQRRAREEQVYHSTPNDTSRNEVENQPVLQGTSCATVQESNRPSDQGESAERIKRTDALQLVVLRPCQECEQREDISFVPDSSVFVGAPVPRSHTIRRSGPSSFRR